MRHWDELATYDRDGYEIIVDKIWEDMDPNDLFETEDAPEICRKINDGTYDWFMLRVRVLVEGLEIGSSHVGGFLYEDARDVLKDGTAEDMIAEAMTEAKGQIYRLYRKFQDLSWELDAEAA